MFNNIVLDIFIGLVLIYLLYSLFITIISEMIVTWMALRSRILRVAIEKMLNDGYKRNIRQKDWLKRSLGFIPRYFLKEFEGFKYSMAGKFYDNPSIKYLSDNGGEKKFFFSQTKPSYISADMFAETLLQLLIDKGDATTDLDKIKFCLKFNTHHIEPNTLKHLRDLLESSGDDMNVLKDKFKAWYHETMDRATGWYKRKIQLILFWLGLIVAIIFNVDTIQIAKILSKDKDARSQLVSMGVELAKDSSRYKDFTGKADSLHTQVILDSGYARVTKDMSEANMVLGLGWNTDKLTCDQQCKFNSKADSRKYNIIKIQLGEFNRLQNAVRKGHQSIKQEADSIIDIAQKLKHAALDTLFVTNKLRAFKAINKNNTDPSLNREYDSLKNRFQLRSDSLDFFRIKYSNDSLSLKIFTTQADRIYKIINPLSGNEFTRIDSITIANDNLNTITVYGKRSYSGYEKLLYVFRNIFSFGKFFGLFITALMLSLGAPFWFDLLKKLISIRGSGIKPEEKTTNDNSTTEVLVPVKPVTTPQTAVIVAPETAIPAIMQAVLKAKAALQNVSGIIDVSKGFTRENDKKTEAIEVEAVNDQSLNDAKQVLGKVYQTYPVKYLINSNGEVHSLHIGQTISNVQGKNGLGTLGCFVKKENSDEQYLLSCWHVLKGDYNWQHMTTNQSIIDSNQKEIAKLFDGCLTNKLDVGFASLIKNENITAQFNSNWRPVNSDDVFNEMQVSFTGANSGNQTAVIYNDGKAKWLDYPDKIKRKLEDLLVITSFDEDDEHVSPSDKGDSGAVVIDSAGTPLGIVVGGDDVYTYVIKFSNIISEESIYKEYKLII